MDFLVVRGKGARIQIQQQFGKQKKNEIFQLNSSS